MALTKPLTVLPDEQLHLAGDISICTGNYNDVDSRRVAMANVLAFAYLSISDQTARETLRTAASHAGLTIEVLA